MLLAKMVLPSAHDALAPDGSEVRLLSTVSRGGMAHFRLLPTRITRAVYHRTVEELWYIVSGTGRIWRKLGSEDRIDDVHAGVSISIPTGTAFQFRCDGDEALDIVGVTMPPWPGPDEAVFTDGPWSPA